MTTPIAEFLRGYQREGMSRFHMPGHKGEGPLGCENWDLTEIEGADSLYEASGIIAESEKMLPPCLVPERYAILRRVQVSVSGPCCIWRFCTVRRARRG